MVEVIRIEDEGDVRLADYRNVPDPELLARRQLFVAEGRLVVRRLLAVSRMAARSVMVTEPALAAIGDLLEGRPGLPVYVVPQRVMDLVTGFNIHRGCLALGERPAQRSWADLAGAAARLAILERVGNADNVGAVFRSAAALGFDGVLLGPSCADPLYRKAIRTSMGAALTLPFAALAPWPEALHRLRGTGWTVLALVPAPDAPPLWDVIPGTVNGKVAVAIGHEGEGLTADARGACGREARIPMAPGIDSLNAATAAAIAFYEVARARRPGHAAAGSP